MGRRMLAYRIALTLISIAIVLIAFGLITGTKLVKYLPERGLRAKLAGTRTPESRTEYKGTLGDRGCRGNTRGASCRDEPRADGVSVAVVRRA